MGCGLSLSTPSTANKKQQWDVAVRSNTAHGSSHHAQASRLLGHCKGLLRPATVYSSPRTSYAASIERGRPAWSPSSSTRDSLLDQYNLSDGPQPSTHLYTEQVASMQSGALEERSIVDDFDAISKQSSIENPNWSYDVSVDAPPYEPAHGTKKEGTTLLSPPGMTPGQPPYAVMAAASARPPRSVSRANSIGGWIAAKKAAKTSVSVKQPIPSATAWRASMSTNAGHAEVLAPSAQRMPRGSSCSESPAAPDKLRWSVVDAFAEAAALPRSTNAGQGWKRETLPTRHAVSTPGTAAHSVECVTDMSLTDEYDLNVMMRAAETPLTPSRPLSAHSTQSPKVKGAMSTPHPSFLDTVSADSSPFTLSRTSAPLGSSPSPTSSSELTTTESFERAFCQSKPSTDSQFDSFFGTPLNRPQSRERVLVDSENRSADSQYLCQSDENALYSFYAIGNNMDPFLNGEEDTVMCSAHEEDHSELFTIPHTSCASHDGGSEKTYVSLNKRDDTEHADSDGHGDDVDKGLDDLSSKTSAAANRVVDHTMPVLGAATRARKERRRTVKIVDHAAPPSLGMKTPAKTILMK
ncbi:hypothetical protein LMXM_30_2195 [Leishmania mexicana MHOM/GT/2001/U1103]|uniref:Uncharacterized protein n=1 Tax=Leishmania mexicana (strain MHOM/GT/2001/U1103) TaxID=929439 RepID=E9B220_LEIMU|nr:hypothetical protein LMXM_30_2195 [Leishmania mexicana MHOM/GT/2001/U1103]CBZ29277.1 hypothetical protein LMXM_30_2195 [Leishmania mexicana MHOM/GT/2001/U1103]